MPIPSSKSLLGKREDTTAMTWKFILDGGVLCGFVLFDGVCDEYFASKWAPFS